MKMKNYWTKAYKEFFHIGMKIIEVLPLVFGVLTFVVLYVYSFPPTDVPLRSTAGISYIIGIPIILIISIIGGFLGSLAVKIIKHIARRRGEQFPEIRNQVAHKTESILSASVILVLIAITIFSYWYSINNPERQLYEEANTFGVKIDEGVIEKIALVSSDLKTHNNLLDCDSLFLELVYVEDGDYFLDMSVFDWLGKSFEISALGWGYSILDMLTGQTILTNILNYYDYLRTVSLSTYEEFGKSYLFALSNLRATSERSLLTVYEYLPDLGLGDIVYEELLYRPYLNLVLGHGELIDKNSVVTVLGYVGGYSDDYDICNLGMEPEDNDFSFMGYGYKLKDSIR